MLGGVTRRKKVSHPMSMMERSNPEQLTKFIGVLILAPSSYVVGFV